MAYILGIPIKRLWLRRSIRKNSEGYVRFIFRDNSAPVYLEKLIAVSLAGLAAEKIHIDRRISWVGDQDARTSLNTLLDIVIETETYRKLSPPEKNHFLRRELSLRRERVLRWLGAPELKQALKKLTGMLRYPSSVESHALNMKLKTLRIRPRYLRQATFQD